jgi:hypothetical protein
VSNFSFLLPVLANLKPFGLFWFNELRNRRDLMRRITTSPDSEMKRLSSCAKERVVCSVLFKSYTSVYTQEKSGPEREGVARIH